MKKIISLTIYPFWILYNALYELINARKQGQERMERWKKIHTKTPLTITSEAKPVDVTQDMLKNVVG